MLKIAFLMIAAALCISDSNKPAVVVVEKVAVVSTFSATVTAIDYCNVFFTTCTNTPLKYPYRIEFESGLPYTSNNHPITVGDEGI